MLAFVHIPKTAGTTLHKIITHQYPKDKIFIHHDTEGPPSEELALRVQAQGASVIMGHFSVGLHEFIPNLRYITCLRDPVSRIASHYRHALNDPSHYLHTEAKSLSLADYATSGLSGELSNGMTRMLAGMEDFHRDPVDEATFQCASHNTESHFDALIPTEHFDLAILRLAENFGWKTPYYIRRKKGRGKAPHIDSQTRKTIREANSFDCRIYDQVLQRNQAEMRSWPDAAAKVAAFQSKQPIWSTAVFLGRELKRRLS
ncbi:MAG: sulfotransferase family 2 domain-containing protein [Luteolibacter sp.]